MTAKQLAQLPAFPVGDQSGVSLRTLVFIHMAGGLAARLETQSRLHREGLIKRARHLTDMVLDEIAKGRP